jgi:hypothetical protein
VCPIRNYQLVAELKDSRYLLKDYSSLKKDEYWDIYNAMQLEVLDKTGLSKEAEELFYKEKDLLKLESAYYSSGDDYYVARIELKNRQIEDLKSGMQTSKTIADINADNHRALTQWLGYDSKTLTVFEYHRNIKILNEERFSEQAREHIKKLKRA